LVEIEGIIEQIVFTNEVNGYTVCDVKCKKETITVVGYMPFVNAGESIRLTGNWVVHRDYGKQLKVEYYEKIMPKTVPAIEKYLASGVIKGIREATAKKIVDRFGEDSLDIIRFSPEKLSMIKGISKKKAIEIGQAFAEISGLTEVAMFLQGYGISPSYSAKIYKKYGEGAIEKIKNNPYELLEEVPGIGFKVIDRMAMSLGIDPASKYRISSGIKYILSQAAVNGHTYLPDEELCESASRLLEVTLNSIEDALIKLMIDDAVYVETTEKGSRNVYLKTLYQAEVEVCRKLGDLVAVNFKEETFDFEEKIKRVQIQENIILADKQKIAIKEAMTNGVLVITGGPGTGKTTIIKCIIKLLRNSGYEVALAAPTGRAAKRMTEATGYEAKTIHRLLEIGYTGDDDRLTFARTEGNPIDADVVIIDETSMVDIILMNHLLKSIPAGCRLILVGDADQLPSVGPGNVLKDIIASGTVKVVHLTEIYRQAEESMIIVNAHRMNKGEYPCLNVKGKDFFFIPKNNAGEIVSTILDLCSKRLPASYNYDPIRHIQVLTPTRKGPIGVSNLNIEMQKVLNPPDKRKKEKAFKSIIYREGDRVMQIRNNYDIRWEKPDNPDIWGEGVFNGDLGVIVEIDEEEQNIVVLFDDDKLVKYDFSIQEEIETAFATTIHKSQGSEFPAVIMPVFSGPPVLMTRNLLYTAVTRAKELVVLVGSEECLRYMVDNQRETLRHSGLLEKLEKCMTFYEEDFNK